MNIDALRIVSVVGLAVSAYAIAVERKVKSDPSYKPTCDISSRVSCTRAFTSEYGKIFGISNSVGGIVFYTAFLALAFAMPQYLLALAIISVAGSIYLAYLSYVKIRVFCLVCTSIYLINITLLLFAL